MDLTDKLRRHFISLIILLFVLPSIAGAASIYKWYDESGQVNYTQTPPPKTATRIERPDGHISVVETNWTPGMKRHASKFMSDARVRRVWVNRDGQKVPGWY